MKLHEQMLKQKLIDSKCAVNNAYLDDYVHLIVQNKTTKATKGSTQLHHIIPKSYFKYKKIDIDHSSDNIVNLSFSDHILAHYLLMNCAYCEHYRNCNAYAIQFLTGNIVSDIDVSDRALAVHQQAYQESMKIISANNVMNNKEIKDKHDAIMRSDIVRQKISQSMKDYVSKFGSKNQSAHLKSGTRGLIYVNKDGDYTAIQADKLSAYEAQGWVRGGKPLTNEHRQALIKSHTGKKYSEVSRAKMSQSHMGKSPANKGVPCSEDVKRRLSESISGRKWVTNDVVQKQIKPEQLELYLSMGFHLGRLKKREKSNDG